MKDDDVNRRRQSIRSNAQSPLAVSRREFLRLASAGAAGGLICGGWRAYAAADAPGAAPAAREARFYEKLANRAVRCGICPRACVVPEGGRGYCEVRENRRGTYYSLVYGYPASVHVDPIEKKPLFHVYPGSKAFSMATAGCNIDCKFCQNWELSQSRPEDISPAPAYTTPAAVAAAAARSGARAIAYTYNEPTVFYEYMADCARAGRDVGVESVVVTNGFISAAPQKELMGLVKAVKVDLKAFTPGFYRDVCDGFLEPVLESLKRLKGGGMWIEIVVLLIPTLNDAPGEIRRMSDWILKELGPDVPLHFTRYHPQYKMRNLPPTPLATLARARAIAMAQGLRFVYTGNAPGAEGQDTACPACRATLIKRYGFGVEALRIVNGKCGSCGAAIPGVW